jgi:uncharacterized protein (TIGR02231 family)
MIRVIAFMALIASGFLAGAQIEKRVDSKITDVTVFLNRAQVTRTVKARVDAGRTSLIVHSLTSMLDQESIQVAGKGKLTILGIAHRQNFSREFVSPRTKPVRDSIELVQQLLVLEQGQKEILGKEEQMLLSNQKIGGTNQNLTVAELKAMADFYRSRLGDIITQRVRHDAKIRDLNERMGKLQAQLRELDELFSKNTSEIVVTVAAEAETAVELEVNYVVGNAGWLPVYDLRATDTKGPVQLTYKANVFQGTGEEWKNVKLKLSTANPALGGVMPELSTWYVDILRPVVRTARYRHGNDKYKAGAPAPAMAEEMVMDSVGPELEDAQSVAQYTSTIQTSLNTEFAIAVPYTVTSSSKPTLVDIAVHSLKADYLYSVAPKLDRDAFLMARMTGWEEFSLLPGEANVFFEGTFVAKSYIDPNSIKDTLAISLGRDKRIVVQREKVKDFTTRKTIGTNQRDAYGYSISIRNTKTEAIKILVEDHLPVSQNSQVEVTVSDVGGAQYNKDTGRLKWEFDVKPQETKKMEYRFEIKYPKDKRISDIY